MEACASIPPGVRQTFLCLGWLEYLLMLVAFLLCYLIFVALEWKTGGHSLIVGFSSFYLYLFFPGEGPCEATHRVLQLFCQPRHPEHCDGQREGDQLG